MRVRRATLGLPHPRDVVDNSREEANRWKAELRLSRWEASHRCYCGGVVRRWASSPAEAVASVEFGLVRCGNHGKPADGHPEYFEV